MPKATQMLRQDHRKVEDLFHKFEQAKAVGAKQRIADQTMKELQVHAQVEEEIFYPAVNGAIENSAMVDEARHEHQEVKSLIGQLEQMKGWHNGAGEEFETKFAELKEAVQHHVEEEEGEMFPNVEESDLDLADLGAQMAERKRELAKEMGIRSAPTRRRARRTKSRATTGRKRPRGKRTRASSRR